MVLMAPKNTFDKKNHIGKLMVFVLIFATFLLTACSDSLESNTDDIPPADAAVTESPTSPTSEPTVAPALEPTEAPVPDPTAEPTSEPTAALTPEPTAEPTAAPTPEPTFEPVPEPTVEPTAEPIAEPVPDPTAAPTPEPAVDPVPEPASDPVSTVDSGNVDEFTYVLNTSTQKIHHPNCKSVAKIKAENYATTNRSLEELLNEGYTKCGNCW